MEQARIEHAPNGSLLAYITIADAMVNYCVTVMSVGCRSMHSLLKLSEMWRCHIWLVDNMKFAPLEESLVGPFLPPILFTLSLSLSLGRVPT